jgi:PAS domain S-box-containing protein
MLAARRRLQETLVSERAARARSDFIGRAGDLLEAPPEPQAMLDQIVRLAVPELARACLVDLVESGELRGATVFAADPAAAEAIAALRERVPVDIAGSQLVAVAARTGEPQLVRDLPAWHLPEGAPGAPHLELIVRLGYRSALVVPLVARGRTLGVLSLLRDGDDEPFAATDLETAVEVARRAALALDNARLFAELRRAQSQLDAVLRSLATAVTVQEPGGDLVYVNQAAAELFGCSSPDELLATPIPQLMGRFTILDEDGRPLDYAQLPGRRALAGEDEPGPVVTRTVARDTGEERWQLTRATPVRDVDGAVALAVNVIEDVTTERRAGREQRLLSAAGALVSASLDIDVTLDRAAWAAVPALADWCCIDVPDERGRVRRSALAVEGPGRERLDEVRASVLLDPGDPRSPAHVLRTGRSLLVAEFGADTADAWSGGEPQAREALLSAGMRSAMVVPMAAGDRVLGMMTFATTHSGRRFNHHDVALAEELGRRAGIAVENARVHAVRTHIATTLQRSLLPPRLPAVPGLTVAARFRAAVETGEVGGDFYDLFAVGDAWMAIVGDVAGKGPEAAAITSLARYTMRTAAMYERSPGAVLERLNTALAVDPERRQLCTAVCVRIELRPDGALALTVACGGHPPPLHVAPAGARSLAVAGPLLGAFAEGEWRDARALLAGGETLVLYTDGVTDACGPDGERFGSERLLALLQGAGGMGPEEVAARVDEALRAFEEGGQRDDVALLVLRAEGLPAAAAAPSALASRQR